MGAPAVGAEENGESVCCCVVRVVDGAAAVRGGSRTCPYSLYAGGGVNSVNSLIATSLPSFFSLTPLNFSALLPIPCPPDVPTMTLPNGDANRDGIIDDADYDLVDTNRGVPDPDPRADLNGDGGSKTTI